MKKSKKTNPKAKKLNSIQKKQLRTLQEKIEERTQELQQSLSLVRATLESTADGILMVSNEGKIEDFNQRFVELLKIPQWVLESKDQNDGMKYMFSVIEDPEGLKKVMQDVMKHPEKQGDIGLLRFKDGRIFERYSLPQRVGDKIVGRVWSFRDITERKKVEEALRLRERAIEASTHGVVIGDAVAPFPIIYVNPAFEKITGYSKAEVIGKKIDFLKGKDTDQVELKKVTLALNEQSEEQAIFRSYRKDGTMFWNEMHIAPVPDLEGKVDHYVSIIVDVTERIKMEDELAHQATHDALTGLPNRSLLYDRLKQSIIHAKREQTLVAVLFLDLDYFKLTNDTMGHGIGDQLLKIISKRLIDYIRETDTIARIGGDEFVIVSTGHKKAEDAIYLAQKILEIISTPFTLSGKPRTITTSIGISIYPSDGKTIENLMKNADMAMYQAKELGRNNFQFFTQQMNQRLLKRLQLEDDLRKATKNNEFALDFQPILELQTGKIIGAEALLRWHHPTQGIVAPLEFIPFAEEIGLIVEIGEWVLETACKQASIWEKDGFHIVTAINISGVQLKSPSFVKSVAKMLKKYEINPKLLELELTESVLMENTEHNLAILADLKKLGLNLVIDDFGTGYSSLSYLTRFPVSKLKIDRSFVNNIDKSSSSAAIVQTIIAMGKNLNLKVLAEGIETQQQLQFLLKHGCHEGQGFYLHRPMNNQACSALLLPNE